MDDLRTLHGDQVFQRREALEAGYTDRDLYGAMREGLLVRVRPGAYTYSDTWAAVNGRLDAIVTFSAGALQEGSRAVQHQVIETR